MRASSRSILLLTFVAATAPSFAAEDRAGRYTMVPTDSGMVRLDTDTGEVALCAKKDGDWACRPMPDSEKSLRGENERLAAENKGLKDEIKRLEETLGIDEPKPGDDGPGSSPRAKIELPTQADLDKAFDYFEGMVRKFRERLRRLDERRRDGTPL